jgi:hypothetical protein
MLWHLLQAGLERLTVKQAVLFTRQHNTSNTFDERLCSFEGINKFQDQYMTVADCAITQALVQSNHGGHSQHDVPRDKVCHFGWQGHALFAYKLCQRCAQWALTLCKLR